MRKTGKRALAFLFCALLCLSLLPAAAFAEDAPVTEDSQAAPLPESAGILPEKPAEETNGILADTKPAVEQEEPAPAEPENDSQSPAPLADDTGVSIDESNFPDPVFRSYVSENVDADADGLLSSQEINSVTSISCIGRGLTSLEGIALFPNLASLDCENNQLTVLDVSRNTALQNLGCSSNQLTVLDVSHNTALLYLACSFNQLTALDVSSNTALEYLYCYDNQLTVLDVSGNTALQNLNCGNNQLTALDVSGNTALQGLYCYNNQLTALDVSRNTALLDLDCGNNQLTALDVSSNTALENLQCYDNQLTALDVSGNTALEHLQCFGNQLTALDVSSNTALINLDCTFNQLTALDVSVNTALEYLWCSNNQLTALDVSGNTSLQNLYCGNNQLTALNVSSNTALLNLYCSNNQLTELDVSENPELIVLYCWSNQLSALDVSGCASLAELDCAYNRLAALDLSGNTNLGYVAFNRQSVSVPCFTKSGEKYIFDLSSLVGAENTGRITSVENGEYDPVTGIAGFAGNCSFTYYYSTGYGDTQMDVYCDQTFHITSFAELKELAAQDYMDWTNVYYDGTGTFVFEEDLVLPENLYFSTGEQDILIPSGVTVTTNYGVSCSTLTVEGTLVGYGEILVENVDVSGSAQMHAPITLWYPGSISGEENVVFFPGEGDERCGFNIHYDVTSVALFEEVLSETGANKPNRYYDLHMHIGDTLTIDKEVVIGENTWIRLFDPVVITENGSLQIDNGMQVSAPMTVKGALINNGSEFALFGVSGYHFDVGITLEETGSYSGNGKITTLFIGYNPTPALEEVLPGFDLTEFDVVEEGEGSWTLSPKAVETVPGDANGDGSVNTMDLIRLMKYISGVEVDVAEGTGDVNGDGKVNTMDLIRLMKYLNGENVELN